ncbi:MAG TPA: hypothetical protein VIX13_05355 [Candidatus Eisenbacteria bacterium]
MHKTGIRHYWRKSLAPLRIAAPACDPAGTLAMLSREPQTALCLLARALAFLTTPFKRLGISGWRETGCDSEGHGTPVRGAQHSTDGFWTIDVRLSAFTTGGSPADLFAPGFLRLEIEPGTAAHAICAERAIGPGMELEFGGAVVVDEDGPFLEVHPDRQFGILTQPAQPAGSGDRS